MWTQCVVCEGKKTIPALEFRRFSWDPIPEKNCPECSGRGETWHETKSLDEREGENGVLSDSAHGQESGDRQNINLPVQNVISHVRGRQPTRR